MSNKNYLVVLIVAFFIFSCFSQSVFGDSVGLLMGTSQPTVPPKKIMAQGRLTDSAGQPLTSRQTITFGIYAQATGGTPVWSSVNYVYPDANGCFTEVIGDSNFPTFGSGGTTYYLGMKDASAREFSNRLPLVSVPMALTACNILGGKVDVFSSGIAIKGNSYGTCEGVIGLNSGTGERVGVKGRLSETVFGELGKKSGAYDGVYGRADNGYGVFGESDANAGVFGVYTGDGSTYINFGELGTRRSVSDFSPRGIGVYGYATNTGIYGRGGDIGICGYASGEAVIAVYAQSPVLALYGENARGYSLKIEDGEIGIRRQFGSEDVACALGTVFIPEGVRGVTVNNRYATENSCILTNARVSDEVERCYATVSQMANGSFYLTAERLGSIVRIEQADSINAVHAFRSDYLPAVRVDYLIIN